MHIRRKDWLRPATVWRWPNWPQKTQDGSQWILGSVCSRSGWRQQKSFGKLRIFFANRGANSWKYCTFISFFFSLLPVLFFLHTYQHTHTLSLIIRSTFTFLKFHTHIPLIIVLSVVTAHTNVCTHTNSCTSIFVRTFKDVMYFPVPCPNLNHRS